MTWNDAVNVVVGRLPQIVRIKPARQLREFFYFLALFSFASALITIFEPVFLYKQGITLAGISAYYAFHYITYILLMPFGARVAARYGTERSLAIAMPLFVLYLIALAALPTWPVLLWILPMLLTLHKMFYWPAYHATMASFGDVSNAGTEISWLFTVSTGLGVLAPIIGGMIATFIGFPMLFVFAGLTIIVASLPLLWTQEQVIITSLPYSAHWRLMSQPQHRSMVLGMIGYSENLIDLVFWPIWMFIVLASAVKLGLVVTCTTLLMTVVGFAVGELNDKYSARKVLKKFLFITVGGYLMRAVAFTPLSVLSTDVVAKIANVSAGIPIHARLYEEARVTGPLTYGLAFETALACSKAFTAIGLTALFYFFQPSIAFPITFVLAAGYSLMYLFL